MATIRRCDIGRGVAPPAPDAEEGRDELAEEHEAEEGREPPSSLPELSRAPGVLPEPGCEPDLAPTHTARLASAPPRRLSEGLDTSSRRLGRHRPRGPRCSGDAGRMEPAGNATASVSIESSPGPSQSSSSPSTMLNLLRLLASLCSSTTGVYITRKAWLETTSTFGRSPGTEPDASGGSLPSLLCMNVVRWL